MSADSSTNPRLYRFIVVGEVGICSLRFFSLRESSSAERRGVESMVIDYYLSITTFT